MKNVKVPPQMFLYGLITIVVIIVLITVMRRVGLIKSGAEKKADKQEAKDMTALKTSQYFDPNNYKTGWNMTKLLPTDTAKLLAQEIEKSWGFLNDDEDRIYSAFRKINYKVNVSQIAEQYALLYKSDLLGVLLDKLHEDEILFIWNIIDGKPR